MTYNWGLSFAVPGIIIGGLGVLIFLFLAPHPDDVGLGKVDATVVNESQSSVEEDPLIGV